MGGFQPPIGTGDGFGHREINSFGNLETIPPYTSKSGVKYPAGRIIVGKHFDRLPAKNMLDFLEGQRLQKPLILESGWLIIGHVDEFVQFLPFDSELGFTISISDTKSAIDLLKKASSAGHGGLPTVTFTGAGAAAGSNTTIDQTLADTKFTIVNEYVQKHIDANLKTLLDEIPLDPKDVIYVPSLFQSSDLGGGNFSFGFGDGLPSHVEDLRPGEYQVASLHLGSINGIVIGKTYVCPKPFGPVIDGVDILAQAVEAAYARAGMNITVNITLLLSRIAVVHVLKCSRMEHCSIRSRTTVALSTSTIISATMLAAEKFTAALTRCGRRTSRGGNEFRARRAEWRMAYIAHYRGFPEPLRQCFCVFQNGKYEIRRWH